MPHFKAQKDASLTPMEERVYKLSIETVHGLKRLAVDVNVTERNFRYYLRCVCQKKGVGTRMGLMLLRIRELEKTVKELEEKADA